MHGPTITILLVALAGLGATGLVWFRGFWRVRKLEAQLERLYAQAERLDEVERLIGGIAHQCEQLSEGQDFLARALTERLPQVIPAVSRAVREITPH